MKKWLSALASYGRVIATVTITTLVNLGHVPATPAEWHTIGVGALWSLLPVILRALNPNDTAYGIGSKASG
jgi:hypothetical protein